MAARSLLDLLFHRSYDNVEQAADRRECRNLTVIQNIPGASTRAALQIKRDLIDDLSKTGTGFADADRLAETVEDAGFADGSRSPFVLFRARVAKEGEGPR